MYGLVSKTIENKGTVIAEPYKMNVSGEGATTFRAAEFGALFSVARQDAGRVDSFHASAATNQRNATRLSGVGRVL
jgi:hypothetical protein